MRCWCPHQAYFALVLLAASLGGELACAPAPSDGGVVVDGRRIGGDAGFIDADTLDGGSSDQHLGRDAGGAALDARPVDVGSSAADAGVLWESFLACLQSAPITIGSCFNDARGRAAAAGFANYHFARAAAHVDADGAVPPTQPGLTYLFCVPDGALYDCLSVDYYWTGATAQISLTQLRRVADGRPRQRLLVGSPDSPEIMARYTSTSDCDLGVAGYVSLNLYSEDQGDRAWVVAASDSLILSDPALEVVENHCVP